VAFLSSALFEDRKRPSGFGVDGAEIGRCTGRFEAALVEEPFLREVVIGVPHLVPVEIVFFGALRTGCDAEAAAESAIDFHCI